ncbi:hypothetical protein HYALB_00011631 [Hymenoscyphus albidus]|uniref:U-box domain-containing protein n=1 Tax=Hymenoscyphus albidus TaxID=595503 RepID=A0A9N9LN30_9HELO|nr:hypothetical protein HYALB_00011631 [Hymenoscyphus albidus]
MAKDDGPQSRDPTKALEYKEKGNRCFQSGDFKGAHSFYTQAISYDPTNPAFFTNRATACIKLQDWQIVIDDSVQAIDLQPENMKAFYNLAQAQIALDHPGEALSSAKKAHELCVKEIHSGGKGGSSITVITELVLRCKKEGWEKREKARERGRDGLNKELIELLRRECEKEEKELVTEGRGDEVTDLTREYEIKIEELKSTFEMAKIGNEMERKKKVPDWVVDDITFSVMFDPVVTKTGQSYDRSSIMEHLKRSPTDPLTREPLRVQDLRPNLALKAACEEYLENNGWAVDW